MLPPESSKNKAPVDGGSLIFFARDEGSAKKSGFEFQRVNANTPAVARKGRRQGCWWAIGDSNPGPTGYEPVALTN